MDGLRKKTKELDVDNYIETKTILECRNMLRRRVQGRSFAFLGPKGYGKTCALKYIARKHEFSDLTAIYVDLKVIRVLGSVNNQRHVLLMDNAQMYDGEFPVDEFKLILAAYSPNAQVASKGPKFLQGKAGTSTVFVYFLPFCESDLISLVRKSGHTIVADVHPLTSDFPDVANGEIQQHQFDRIQFVTNGNPRYVSDYLLQGNFSTMEAELQQQLAEILRLARENLLQYYKSLAALCKSIIMAFSGGMDHRLINLGLAYKYTDGKIYLANNMYFQIAVNLGYLKVYNNSGGLDFTNLETLCDFVICSGAHDLDLPVITDRMVQEGYDDPIPTQGIVLVRLKRNHPAIDFLIVDNPNCYLYFVQTSFQRYDQRDTKYDAIHSLQIKELSVLNFYLKKTRLYALQKYIFATYCPTKVRDENVTILRLNCYRHLLQE